MFQQTRLPFHSALIIACALAMTTRGYAKEATNPDPARFNSEIEAFEHWDAKNSFPHDAILFVGSSSIRFWQTADAFPGLPVINRGFGGSHISDVNHFADRIVFKYRPAHDRLLCRRQRHRRRQVARYRL